MSPEQLSIWDQFTPGPIESVPFFGAVNPVSMLRLDKLKSWAQGNKYYKLKYALRDAMQQHSTAIVSKGGMHSNHLAALSDACNVFKFDLTCIIRAYQPDLHSPTIQKLIDRGATIVFLSPDAYDSFDARQSQQTYPKSFFIDEGGLSKAGISGAGEMANEINPTAFDIVVIAGGSMCTVAGLISKLDLAKKLIIVPAWKGCTPEYIDSILQQYQVRSNTNWELWPDFHFGGFGKWDVKLLNFMVDFTTKTTIPLDPIYTGKLIFAVQQKLQEDCFEKGRSILVVHTGGLQGMEGFKYRFPEWNQYADLIIT